MADTETLDRLSGIVTGLQPLGDMARGMPLRSTDWNTMVAAVVDLARLSVSRERIIEQLLDDQLGDAGGVPDASAVASPDAVALKELAADLRAARDEIASLRADVTAAGERIRKLEQATVGLRDADRVRQDSLTGLGDELAKLRGLDGRLTQLNGVFAGVTAKMDQALDVGAKLLSATDSPLVTLTRRTEALEGLREQLSLADGTLAQMRDFERDIAALKKKQAAGGGSGLDVAGLRAEILAQASATLDTRLAPVTSSVDGLRASVEALPGRLGAVEGRVTVVEGLGGRVTAVEANLAGATTLGGRVALVESRLGAIDALGGRVVALEDRVAETQPLAGRLDALEKQSGLTDKRVDQMEKTQLTSTERLDKIEGRLPRLELAATSVDQLVALPSLVATLGTTVDRLDGAAAAASSRLDVVEAQTDDLAAVPARLTAVESLARSSRDLLASANLPDLAGRLGVAETKLNAQATATARIGALADQLATTTSRVAAVESAQASGNATVLARVDAVERQTSTIAALSTRLTAVERGRNR